MKNIAIIGLGSRGALYADIIRENNNDMNISAICDNNIEKIKLARSKYQLDDNLIFDNEDEFFNEKRGDILVVSTQDKDHFRHVMKALDLGYDILLEKPISPSLDECIQIEKRANELGRRIAVCHVLRFTPFYQKIKEIIDSNILGDIITISQTENVGYFHQAHSFVRGQWNKKETSAPMILAKCCHDLDMIYWLIGKKCQKVSSFGSLSYFKEENAPEGSANYCYKCKIKDCPYNAVTYYNNFPDWAFKSNYYQEGKSITELWSDETNPFARCVFKCDNDVVDHQVVNLLFEDNRTAQLTMTAFSKDIHRNIKIHGTKGELEGDMEKLEIYVNVFGKESTFIDVSKLADDFSVHGGGDRVMLKEFVRESTKNLTSISNSVHSHKMAFAAEESRLNEGKVIEIED